MCAARIRFIRIYHQFTEAECKLIRALLLHNNGKVFLPSLKQFYCAANRQDSPLVASFDLPSIDILHLMQLRVHQAVLYHTGPLQVTPFLRTLVVDRAWPHIDDVKLPIVDITLGLFKHLRCFKTYYGQVGPSELKRLEISPILEELDLHVIGFESWRSPLHLPKIQRLCLTGTPGNISALISHLHAPLLTHFEAFIKAKCYTNVAQCIRGISSTLFRATLRSLKLRISILPIGSARKDEILKRSTTTLSSLLGPSFSMAKLEVLALEGPTIAPYYITTTHHDISTVAQGLKHLRSISLTDIMYLYEPRSLQLTPDRVVRLLGSTRCIALVTVLQHITCYCPQLVELELDKLHIEVPQSVDLQLPTQTSDDGHALSAASSAANHPLRLLSLRYLNTGRYRFTDPVVIAEYLNRLFPYLDLVHMRRETPISHIKGGWNAVLDGLAARRRRR